MPNPENPVDTILEKIINGETIRLSALATESPLQTLAKRAEPIMALARKNGVDQVIFQVGAFKVTVRNQ